jgi:alpha-galactosidase
MVPEAEHIKQIDAIGRLKLPFDTYWIDAGWYGKCKQISDWYAQSGNWFANADLYPRGLKPVSDAAHKQGLKFLLWFDPERVYKDSELHHDHPEWLLRTKTVVEGWCG